MCNLGNAWKEKCKQLENENTDLTQKVEELEKEIYNLKHPEPSVEKPSPKGEFPRSVVRTYPDRIEVRVNNLQEAILVDSNSMDGMWDTGHTILLKEDFDRDSLIVGDIPVYDMGDGANIIHPIISIDEDEEGKYYTTQGLNNVGWPDKHKVRNSHIKYIVVGWINTHDNPS
ncbi:MAG TPA: hypothetical protein G4O15_12790 [Dehalococcoidia bacterium]|nr:hypothetical protein [Dehalococcoidia bacterium]